MNNLKLDDTHPAEAFVAACLERAKLAKKLVKEGHDMDPDECDELIERLFELRDVPCDREIWHTMSEDQKRMAVNAMKVGTRTYKNAMRKSR